MAVKYFSLKNIRKHNMPFNIIIGGRGTGKTFNSIRECTETGDKIIYMRRTQDEVDLICKRGDDVELSPFAKINKVSQSKPDMVDHFYDLKKVDKKVYNIYDGLEDNQFFCGEVIALSTIATIRGFDADWCDVVLADEFVPEKHVRLIASGNAEGEAWLNAYETINRNREFEGRKPVQIFWMSNAFNIAHPLLNVLNVTGVLERMRRKKQEFVIFPNRGLTITLYEDAEFMEQKKHTALYRLTEGTSFYDMSITNDFAYNDFSMIRSLPLKEYNPICNFDGICIYRHKNKAEFYISLHMVDCKLYQDTEQGRRSFRMDYGRTLTNAFLSRRIVFENYSVKRKIMEVVL